MTPRILRIGRHMLYLVWTTHGRAFPRLSLTRGPRRQVTLSFGYGMLSWCW